MGTVLLKRIWQWLKDVYCWHDYSHIATDDCCPKCGCHIGIDDP